VEPTCDSRRVKRIQSYIAQHFCEKIRLEDMAEMVGMTPTSFSRFFKLRT
jgi:transcriptional regulator GlxA family with amidase domain